MFSCAAVIVAGFSGANSADSKSANKSACPIFLSATVFLVSEFAADCAATGALLLAVSSVVVAVDAVLCATDELLLSGDAVVEVAVSFLVSAADCIAAGAALLAAEEAADSSGCGTSVDSLTILVVVAGVSGKVALSDAPGAAYSIVLAAQANPEHRDRIAAYIESLASEYTTTSYSE